MTTGALGQGVLPEMKVQLITNTRMAMLMEIVI